MISKEKAQEVLDAVGFCMSEYVMMEPEAVWQIAYERGISEDTVERYLRIARNAETVIKEEVMKAPKILVFDIETAPILGRVWSLWNNNLGLNQIKNDWFMLSYAAKWVGNDEVIYSDLRGAVKKENDYHLLTELWDLLNEADIVITQNGIRFDSKKVNARFVLNGFQPPSSYKHIDTLVIAKRIFGFTSNKLEYMTDKLCVTHKKLKHAKFAGFELWTECLADNIEAWKEMEAYNRNDVLSLEELYFILAAWDNKHPNFNLYQNPEEHACRCGSKDVVKYGYAYTQVSKFQRYRCKDCGAESRGRKNLFTKEECAGLLMNISQ